MRFASCNCGAQSKFLLIDGSALLLRCPVTFPAYYTDCHWNSNIWNLALTTALAVAWRAYSVADTGTVDGSTFWVRQDEAWGSGARLAAANKPPQVVSLAVGQLFLTPPVCMSLPLPLSTTQELSRIRPFLTTAAFHPQPTKSCN
jgi:hypothetical protein